MKTEEDEAFEYIERKQGGFIAKRKAAADKLQKPVLDLDGHVVRDARKPKKAALAQPAQEQWNAALDEAASRIAEIKGFGQATQDSFAVFIKSLKK